MRIHRIVTVLLVGAALGLLAGCERGDVQAFSSEADEPNFRQGQQLVRQGRNQEALSAYLKVIAKRGESAPESHLEAGLLYLDQVKDPLAAIYHFRKYLELQPNSRQAVYVKGRIDVAKREFARTLPAQPLESQAERLDQLEQIDRLQRENDQMKAELAALRGGIQTPIVQTRGPINQEPLADSPRTETRPRPFISPLPAPPPSEITVADEGDSLVTLAPESPPESARAPMVQMLPSLTATKPAPVNVAPAKGGLAKPTSPAAAAGHRHVVVKGDTLYSLAQKYYANRSRWRDIYAANRDQLPSEGSLRLGMELKIP